MKPVYLMITKKVQTNLEWPQIKQFMMKDFIKEVQNCKADDIP